MVREPVLMVEVLSPSTAAALWVLHPFEPGQDLRLASVAMDLPAALLWEEVATEAAPLRC